MATLQTCPTLDVLARRPSLVGWRMWKLKGRAILARRMLNLLKNYATRLLSTASR